MKHLEKYFTLEYEVKTMFNVGSSKNKKCITILFYQIPSKNIYLLKNVVLKLIQIMI